MNTTWSPLRQDTLFNPSTSLLEMPSVLPQATAGRTGHDTINLPIRFFPAPFADAPEQTPWPEAVLPPPAEADPERTFKRRLKALRKSPGFALTAHSALLLSTCQMDMDTPPGRRPYIRQRLIERLEQMTGQSVNPDQLSLTFTTDDLPSVSEDGHEHYSLQLSLTELAMVCFDTSRMMALYRSTLAEASLADLPLAPHAVSELIMNAHWFDDYERVLEAFWTRHNATYRLLTRLGFLDTLARHYARKRISRDGYVLTLDALGLADFPNDARGVEETGRGSRSEVRALSIDGITLPGIFQVRSVTTSHCFIHVLGDQHAVVEYISNDPAQMARKLLLALNESGMQKAELEWLEADGNLNTRIQCPVIEGDVFAEMTRVQARFASELLSQDGFDRFDLLKPAARGMALFAAVDLWQAQPPILEQIPAPLNVAAQVMGDYLKTQHNLSLDPDQVFIAYRGGASFSALGDARKPGTHIRVPDETPLSLSEALVTHYQVQHPQGYVDTDGRTVVYLDTSGTGLWAADQELQIPPQALEQHIKSIDFLNLMTRRINEFWEHHQPTIEQAFRSTLMTQAVVSLKLGQLKRSGFDLIVSALTRPATVVTAALGFYVQNSMLEGMQHQYTGLLVFELPGTSKVLYQPGHPKAFLEFADADHLARYLQSATSDPHWREALMRYVPTRSHDRLDYLLKLWGRVVAPTPPASILRPWTDALFNPDTREAMLQSLIEKRIEGSAFVFMHQTLKQNALMDAEDQIVTSTQASLRYWTDLLHRLQWLLAPMSLLLKPAFIASLAAEIGLTGLNVASANLPGSRYAEKQQALLSTLSLGLMRLAPVTPRLLRSLNKLAKPGSRVAHKGVTLPIAPHATGSLPGHWAEPRHTRLEKFFHTDTLLKRWTINSAPPLAEVSVHAWKLGRRFLLWTSDRGQARTLVVSTHGYYLPWTSTVKIPNGTELRTYAPHGHELVDPLLHRVVSKRVGAFAVSNAAGNIPLSTVPSLTPLVMTDKAMAGTSIVGRFKNYTLSKFQTTRDETYSDIAHIVRNSNASPYRGQLPPTPMDVLTVRNRFGRPSPTLADLFDTLSDQGIHYDRILLVHCRCAAFAALMQRAPVYAAPTFRPTIVKMPRPERSSRPVPLSP